MQGTEEEKETILRKRILKNFQDYKLKSHLFYVKRREIDPASSDLSIISDRSLLLYGIDFLAEARIRAYFEPYQV